MNIFVFKIQSAFLNFQVYLHNLCESGEYFIENKVDIYIFNSANKKNIFPFKQILQVTEFSNVKI